MAGGSGTVTAMAHVGGEHQVDARSRRARGRRRRRGTRPAARARPASQRILRPARSASAGVTASWAAGSSESPGTLVGTRAFGAPRAPPSSHVRLGARGPQAEVRVQVRPAGVGVDEHDGLAELREVDGEVRRDEALADAPATAADGDEAADALHAELRGASPRRPESARSFERHRAAGHARIGAAGRRCARRARARGRA